MTYNWNNMVPITVPTGTNGWLYSGEVIINGVKVRFPVGVPTSVPEPAAVLLKKMIELEQEEDANTAKPQNHYVGDVTIPAGKTLTLEKGARFVDNSGGGSASAGGGFIFNLSINPDGGDVTADTTYAEVKAALDGGRHVLAKMENAPYVYYGWITAEFTEDGLDVIVFKFSALGVEQCVGFASNDTIQMMNA